MLKTTILSLVALWIIVGCAVLLWAEKELSGRRWRDLWVWFKSEESVEKTFFHQHSSGFLGLWLAWPAVFFLVKKWKKQ